MDDDLMRRSIIRGVTTFVAVAVVGSVLVAATSGGDDAAQPSPSPSSSVSVALPEPQTWLAWVPGGLPSGFGDLVAGVGAVTTTTTAAADIAWLTASFDANGDPVDQPPSPMTIPLDTTAVDPTFAAFVPQPERQLVQNLRAGEAVLSEGAASLRGLGPGSTLVFRGGDELRVAGTLPDDLMGSYEMLVTRETGRRIAVVHDRYVLFHAKGGAKATPDALTSALEELLPIDAPYPVVEVRAPGDTRHLRANDWAMPPLLLKRTFGEFLAHPGDGTELVIDPTWVQDHIRSVTLPTLGTVTCNDAIVPALKQAVRLLAAGDQTALVTDVGACFAPTFAITGPNGPIDEASWGVAVQLNPSVNFPGQDPDQSKTLVQAMARAGFDWGGDDAYPQGALFRYQKANQAKD